MNNAFFTKRFSVILAFSVVAALCVGGAACGQDDDVQIRLHNYKRPFYTDTIQVIANQSRKINDDKNYFVTPFKNPDADAKETNLIPIEPKRNYQPLWDDEELTCYGPFYERERLVARVKPIENVDFTGIDLQGSIFKGKFVNCSFANANLSHVDAREAEFVNCDFSGADVRYIKGLRVSLEKFLMLRERATGLFNLQGADITVYNDSPTTTVVNLGASDLSHAKITKDVSRERGEKFYFILSDCKLDYYQTPVALADNARPRLEKDDALDSLRLRALDDCAPNSRADLVVGLTISGVDQTYVDLSGYTFIDCTFDQCDFDAIKIDDAVLVNCAFTESVKNLNEEKLQTTINRKENMKANLIKTQGDE